MERREIIQRSMDYIESNLQTEICAEELAGQAGFSLYHYYRLFQAETGMPVMRYILRRRLRHAIYSISCGSLGVDAALRYGFDTYAGFYRAFQREFGCTPSAYLAAGRARRPYRPDLSKEEHMTVTKQKAAEFLRHWELQGETVTEFYYESTGNHNDSAYNVGADYVLKFTADFVQLQKQLNLSRALEAADIPAATPVPTPDGRDYVQTGGLFVWLSRRLPGQQLLASACYGDDALAQRIGEQIGRLHQVLSCIDVPVDETALFQTVKTWALPQTQSILQLPENFCRDYLTRFEALQTQLPRQIIHRDPNPGNIFCAGERLSFAEFELSERNVRIYDPCYAATAILSETFDRLSPGELESWCTIYRAIFRGYDCIARLTDAEREAVPYVLLANQMICVAYFSQVEKYAEIFETNKRMTRWLLERWDQLQL